MICNTYGEESIDVTFESPKVASHKQRISTLWKHKFVGNVRQAEISINLPRIQKAIKKELSRSTIKQRHGYVIGRRC